MNFAFLNLVPLLYIYGVVRSDTSASETPLDKVLEMMTATLNRWGETITELEKDVPDLAGPKPEFMTFSKKDTIGHRNIRFGPDELSRSRTQDMLPIFSESESVFHVPVTGTYQLSFTIDSKFTAYAFIAKAVDGRNLCYMAHESLIPDKMSFSVLVYLTAKEKVWVACSKKTVCMISQERTMSFSGFLIEAK